MKLAEGFVASLCVSFVLPLIPHNALIRAVFVGNLYSVTANTFWGILCQLLWLWRLPRCWQSEKFCTKRNWYRQKFFFLSPRLFCCWLDALSFFFKDIDATPTVRG